MTNTNILTHLDFVQMLCICCAALGDFHTQTLAHVLLCQ